MKIKNDVMKNDLRDPSKVENDPFMVRFDEMEKGFTTIRGASG